MDSSTALKMKESYYTKSRSSVKVHKRYSAKAKNTGIALLVLSPILILYSVFFVFPFLFSAVLSVADWNMITKEISFVGIKNYKDIFADSSILKVVGNTAVYTIGTVAGTFIIAFGLALMVNSLKDRWKGICRTLFFIPFVTSLAIMSIAWKSIMDPTGGLLNSILEIFGVGAVNWLYDPKWSMFSVIIVGIWHGLGYSVLLLTTSLMSVDKSLYEAVNIDGGGRISGFFHVTLPQTSPTLMFVIVNSIIASFRAFESVNVMTQGGPDNATNVIGYKIWQEGFQFFDSGKANALSVLLFAVLVISVIFIIKGMNKKVCYD